MLLKISEFFQSELMEGNAVWRFGLVLLGILITLAAGKILQFIIQRIVNLRRAEGKKESFSIFLESISKPIFVGVFAIGLYVCRTLLVWDNPDTAEVIEGLHPDILKGWIGAAKIIGVFALASGLNKLLDVVEHVLGSAVKETNITLDDMLVPIIRRAVRITIIIVAVLFVLDLLIGLENIKSVLVGAGVGGIAIALAAKDTVANLFGSITIFADKPFQINDLVRIENFLGTIEEVGFRSTRLRTLDGHQVTVPNEKIAQSMIENLGRRPFIRRTSNITITYDSGPEKAEKAVTLIKEILTSIPEISSDANYPPRVYFDEFNDCSLNIYMSYWVRPVDFWFAKETHQRINLEMMRRFRDAGIEFAFPTQTLYIKKDDDRSWS